MAKPKRKKLHQNISVAYSRIRSSGEELCRQASGSEEAVKKGGGFVYFLKRSGREMSPVSSRFLIENGLVEGDRDGLFPGLEQSFRACPFEKFEAFKAAYEAPAHV